MVLLYSIPRGALPITLQLLRFSQAFPVAGLVPKPFGNKAGWILSARLSLVKGSAEQIADAGEGFADIGRQITRPGLVSGGFTPIGL
jgi:hypothetical protein